MIRKFQGSAFMLFLMLYIIGLNFIVIPLIADIMTHIGHREPFLQLLFSPWGIIIFPQMLGLLLPLVIWLTIKREDIHIYMRISNFGITNVILIVFISIFLQPLMMLIAGISSLFTPNLIGNAVGGMVQQYPWWLLMLAIAVTPSIIEELLFRGYIQTAYKDRPFRKAAIINGLFFGIMHLNIHQFTYAFVMGIIFAYMVHYTRSVLAGMLSHFIMNGIQVTLIYLTMQMQIPESAYLFEAFETTVYSNGSNFPMFEISDEILGVVLIGVIALISTPCAFVLFRAFKTYNRQRNIKHDLQQALNTSNIIDISSEIFKNNSLAEFLSTQPEEFSTIRDKDKENENKDESELGRLKSLLNKIDPFLIASVVLFLLLWLL